MMMIDGTTHMATMVGTTSIMVVVRDDAAMVVRASGNGAVPTEAPVSSQNHRGDIAVCGGRATQLRFD
jgi:hypothetical protein